MVRFIAFFLLIIAFDFGHSQVEFLNAPYDIGVVTAAGSDYLDIQIKNTSAQKIFIFRTDADKRFQIHYSNKTILPDSVIFMRVLFTPDKKGVIHEKLPIHFSCYDSPIEVDFTGFTEEIPSNESTSCPDFNQQSATVKVEFDFTVKVIDAQTNELLKESEVVIIKNGLLQEVVNTKNKGYHSQKMELGYYYFIGSHEGYENNELGTYVNRKNNIVTIPLTKLEQINEVVAEQVEIEIPEVIELDSIENEPQHEIAEEEIIPIDDSDPYPNFSLKDFKPNNIVFLVDVSSSMNQGGKLDLLKASMIELTKILRPVDKITVVSYATRANVILETTSGQDIDSVIKVIQGLTASGVTAGGKGMDKAYAKACNAFISNGNNQIIMATDGLFNSGDENVYKLAKTYSKKGVKVSVIGIKNQPTHEKYMKDLANDGKGNYVNVTTFQQAQETLVNEIKSQSKIK